MNLNINIPFESEKGNQYALVFSVYEPLSDISIPVVEVSLALKKQVTSTNSLKVFNYIIKEIEEYLSKREYITEIVRNDSYLPNILEVNSFIHFLSKLILKIY